MFSIYFPTRRIVCLTIILNPLRWGFFYVNEAGMITMELCAFCFECEV